MMQNRRQFLGLLAALATSSLWPQTTQAAQTQPAVDDKNVSTGTPFSWSILVDTARQNAQQPYQPTSQPHQDILQQIDWAAHGQIQFHPEHALFANGPGQYPIEFFHPGKFFQTPVHMYRLDDHTSDQASDQASGQDYLAHEILFNRQYFDMPADSPAQKLGADTQFAGFRIQESRLIDSPDWRYNDWAAFLGASYFRAIGDEYQYGLSARGIAINVTVAGQNEEFPAFTKFYFSPAHDNTLIVYALLDGPSISGAYRFTLARAKDVVMEISAELFLRRDVARFGIAPATSMYWFAEKDKPFQIDWRPEVHDSDGLALWTGNDEHLWRPLNNPTGIAVSAFSDHNPRGFGLMQRQRHFDNYLDSVHYERRPSLWIEPLQDWGSGAVQLVELHTSEEIYDNVVAMWVPAEPAKAGHHYSLHYRLTWAADAPVTHSLARCIATRIGRAGEAGNRPADSHKFEIEFEGDALQHLAANKQPQIILSTSQGKILNSSCEPVPGSMAGQHSKHWRVFFDLGKLPTDQPAELRLKLSDGQSDLTETWLYQFAPPTLNQTAAG